MQIFEATCAAGIVIANGGIVPNCPVMGEGGTSSGYLVISQDELFYLPKTTPDVSSLITLLQSLCDQIVALTVISAAPGSPTSTPVNALQFAAIKTQLTTLKAALK